MIWYAHVNEDSGPERTLLKASGLHKAVVVAGSGERVIALMDLPELREIDIVDLNPDAIMLLRLKLLVLKRATPDEYLRFVGHLPGTPEWRMSLFTAMQDGMDERSRAFWRDRMAMIRNGILRCGHYEAFLDRVRPMLRVMLGKGIDEFLGGATRMSGHLHEMAWTMLKKCFGMRWVYRLNGLRDTAFIGKGAEVRMIPEVMDGLIRSGKAGHSFMCHLVFRGQLNGMDPDDLPWSLRPDRLSLIGERLRSGTLSLTFHEKDLLEHMRCMGPERQALFCSASDILSFEDARYLQQLTRTALQRPDDLMVVRSFLVNRLPLEELRGSVDADIEVGESDPPDATGMYQVLTWNRKRRSP